MNASRSEKKYSKIKSNQYTNNETSKRFSFGICFLFFLFLICICWCVCVCVNGRNSKLIYLYCLGGKKRGLNEEEKNKVNT